MKVAHYVRTKVKPCRSFSVHCTFLPQEILFFFLGFSNVLYSFTVFVFGFHFIFYTSDENLRLILRSRAGVAAVAMRWNDDDDGGGYVLHHVAQDWLVARYTENYETCFWRLDVSVRLFQINKNYGYSNVKIQGMNWQRTYWSSIEMLLNFRKPAISLRSDRSTFRSYATIKTWNTCAICWSW